jgi:hypothetical protein
VTLDRSKNLISHFDDQEQTTDKAFVNFNFYLFHSAKEQKLISYFLTKVQTRGLNSIYIFKLLNLFLLSYRFERFKFEIEWLCHQLCEHYHPRKEGNKRDYRLGIASVENRARVVNPN